MPVNRAVVYLDGEPVYDGPISPEQKVELPLEVQGEGFVFAEVYGDADESYSAVAPGHTPLAFTNVIRVGR